MPAPAVHVFLTMYTASRAVDVNCRVSPFYCKIHTVCLMPFEGMRRQRGCHCSADPKSMRGRGGKKRKQPPSLCQDRVQCPCRAANIECDPILCGSCDARGYTNLFQLPCAYYMYVFADPGSQLCRNVNLLQGRFKVALNNCLSCDTYTVSLSHSVQRCDGQRLELDYSSAKPLERTILLLVCTTATTR